MTASQVASHGQPKKVPPPPNQKGSVMDKFNKFKASEKGLTTDAKLMDKANKTVRGSSQFMKPAFSGVTSPFKDSAK